MIDQWADGWLIEQLGRAYSNAASRLDAEGVASCFSEEGVLSQLPRLLGRDQDEVAGRTNISALFSEFLPGVEFIHQMSQMTDVAVSGDSATAEFMIAEHVRWRGRD